MDQDLYAFLMDLQVAAQNSGRTVVQKIDAYLLKNPLPVPVVAETVEAPVEAPPAKPAAKK